MPQLNPSAEAAPGQLITPTKYERVYVEAPVPTYPGGRELRHLPPMEMNVTRGPTGYLDADPRGQRAKEWYNTWLYVPEPVRGGEDPQFGNRFTAARIERDPDGDGHTYLDRVQIDRKYDFYKQKADEHLRKTQEDAEARAGVGLVQDPTWSDAYTGMPVVEFQGRLVHKAQFMEKHGVSKADWDGFTGWLFDGYSFDSLRIPWPFERGEQERNKMVTASALQFDRRHPLYRGDAGYTMTEAGRSYYAG
jgi:hypothetical protein